MLSCVFWNIKDALPPNQRGIAPQKSNEGKKRNTREEKEADNKRRAPNLVTAIVNIAQTHEIDLFLLAEYHFDNDEEKMLLRRLEQLTGHQFQRLPNSKMSKANGDGRPNIEKEKHIAILTHLEPRWADSNVQQLGVVEVPADPLNEEPFDESRLTLRALYLPGEPAPLLLACVHLVSKLNADSITQREEARRIARRIRLAERSFFDGQPPRTIVVGDFNMNPWEEGLILPDAFHSVEWFDQNWLDIRWFNFDPARATRTLLGKQYPYFYNPIWAHLGDGGTQPIGTYFARNQSAHTHRRWNLYDQILLRPAALVVWPVNHPDGCLRILDKAGNLDLTTDSDLTNARMKVPNASVFSDHLPILFRLGTYDAAMLAER